MKLPDPATSIEAIRVVRRAAVDLRNSVSHGEYGDDELARFREVVADACTALSLYRSQLSLQAGLHSNFVTTITTQRGRPKLQNFLRLLTTIVDLADSRIAIEERASEGAGQYGDLLRLATSLANLAAQEIERIDSERPNDPLTQENLAKQRELLKIFARGFEEIAQALTPLATRGEEPVLLGRANTVVNAVAGEVQDWIRNHGSEVVDWGARIGTITAGVAALGWAGANMTVATTVVAAIVGGKKVVDAIKNKVD